MSVTGVYLFCAFVALVIATVRVIKKPGSWLVTIDLMFFAYFMGGVLL